MAETAALVASPRAQAIQKQQETAEIFRPSSFTEAMEFAKVLSESGMVPKPYVGKPGAIIAAWQHGLELGVGLFQALGGISNINGNVAVYGDLGWALVQNHPDFVDSIEEVSDTKATCTLKRRGRSDKTQTYTIEMAKQNELLGKDNWKKNPRRMLQWRARSWAMRDQFPDALKGMVIYEEAQDYPGPTIDAEPLPQKTEQKPAEPEDPPIGPEKASQWYNAYKANGHTPKDSKKWLKENLGIEAPKDSRDIPSSKFGLAMEWANSKVAAEAKEEPTKTEPNPAEVSEDEKNAREGFSIIGWNEKEIGRFVEQYNGDWAKINEEVKRLVDKRTAEM